MSRTGRPTNSAARLDILQRIAAGKSMGEIVREGPYNRGQVQRYVRSLRSDGLVVPDPHFSHLDTDGGAALRFAVTPGGALVLAALTEHRHGKSTTPRLGKSPDVNGTRRPAGVVGTTLTEPGRGPVLASQVFAGVHAVCARYALEGAPENVSGWRSRVVSGVTMRWLTLGSGARAVTLQLAADRTLTAKYKVDANRALPVEEQARDVEERKIAIAYNVRRQMARALRCGLSEPEFRGTAKWSVLRDPVAAAVRTLGTTLHGEGNGDVGVDDTPEVGTLEYTGSGAVDAVREHTLATRAVGRGFEEVRELVGSLLREARADRDLLVAISEGALARDAMIRELLVRVATNETRLVGREPATAGPTPRGTWGEARAA